MERGMSQEQCVKTVLKCFQRNCRGSARDRRDGRRDCQAFEHGGAEGTRGCCRIPHGRRYPQHLHYDAKAQQTNDESCRVFAEPIVHVRDRLGLVIAYTIFVTE